jgi:hypothetical protein
MADPPRTIPVPMVSVTTTDQQVLTAAEWVSASGRSGNPAGNPLVYFLKPKSVTSGYTTGDSPMPGATKPTSFKVDSPRGEPLCVAVSGVPSLGTGDARAQPISGPSAGGPSLTPVSGVGGGEVPTR